MESDNNIKAIDNLLEKSRLILSIFKFFKKKNIFLLSQKELNKKYFFHVFSTKEKQLNYFFLKNLFFKVNFSELIISSNLKKIIKNNFFKNQIEKQGAFSDFVEGIIDVYSSDFPCLCGDCEKYLTEDESISEYINYENQDLNLISNSSQEYWIQEIPSIKEILLNPEIDYKELLQKGKPSVNLFQTFREERKE